MSYYFSKWFFYINFCVTKVSKLIKTIFNLCFYVYSTVVVKNIIIFHAYIFRHIVSGYFTLFEGKTPPILKCNNFCTDFYIKIKTKINVYCNGIY